MFASFAPILQREAGRWFRHAITPIAVAAVASGWLPGPLAGQIADVLVVGGSYAVSLILSRIAKR